MPAARATQAPPRNLAPAQLTVSPSATGIDRQRGRRSRWPVKRSCGAAVAGSGVTERMHRGPRATVFASGGVRRGGGPARRRPGSRQPRAPCAGVREPARRRRQHQSAACPGGVASLSMDGPRERGVADREGPGRRPRALWTRSAMARRRPRMPSGATGFPQPLHRVRVPRCKRQRKPLFHDKGNS